MSDGKEIWVKYSVVGGAHFFTGADPYSQGLCVAHKDLKMAYDEVPIQLKNLLGVNHGIHADVGQAVPYEEFFDYVKNSPPQTKMKPSIPFELETEKAA
jgi:hypothetical protein